MTPPSPAATQVNIDISAGQVAGYVLDLTEPSEHLDAPRVVRFRGGSPVIEGEAREVEVPAPVAELDQ